MIIMNDKTGWLISGIFLLFLIGISIVFGLLSIQEKACENAANIMNVTYKYDGLAGCFLKVNGNFYSAKSVINNNVSYVGGDDDLS